jgi:hypothetical protein
VSADRWERCPFCVAAAQLRHEQRTAEIAATYGEVSSSEYLDMVATHPAEFDPSTVSDSLREDWDLGFDGEATGYVHFKAECADCGASMKFEAHPTLEKSA